MSDFPFSKELVQLISKANHVGVLTGAGISKESGLSTFRDLDGYWAKFRPEELARVDAFLENPMLVQGWYQERYKAAFETQPNAGHLALVTLEAFVPEFTLITQNVDNLHQRAGSKNVVELHGNIMRSYCIKCHKAAPEIGFTIERTEPWQCEDCKGLIRPDVVWFGEMLPNSALEKAIHAAEDVDVFLSVGTSAVVYPAAEIPLVAHASGAYVAEFNIEPSAIAHRIDETVLGKSGETLPAFINAMKNLKDNF